MLLTSCLIECYYIVEPFFSVLFYFLKLGFICVQRLKAGKNFFSPVFPQRAVYKFGTVLD